MKHNNYDDTNVFAKIIRGELPCSKIYEDDDILAFHDIYPVAPIHVIVIPKGNYKNFADFVENAKEDKISRFFAVVNELAKKVGAENNFRLITNNGEQSGQTIFHFHVHIISGKELKNLA